ncbi:hypothetical protein J421_0315 [Gemmatirosa kalamazoonensis]|uniref:Uncharacterized protein n=1 Tax=Gemmatirosa kalamazoonensis TaxID=861299 RepID=W0RBM0_9BACT|nr:hypothetical protein [Gemmatirosa kalamazoonensis]AHG87852.1 hypothetical protein J421_0315 [Gemmatirosa kalamazoonensis]
MTTILIAAAVLLTAVSPLGTVRASGGVYGGVLHGYVAQGGWRQWDVRLRDGTHVDANPLGAPDDTTLAVSVGGLTSRGRTLPRARVRYVAARPAAGETLPAAPTGRVLDDVVVRRDGRRTVGRVTLTRVAFSEGVVTQHGVEIDLHDVAYIVFAAQRHTRERARP